MGRFEDYPGLVGTGVQLLENRLGATPQGFESLPLRHKPRFFGAFLFSLIVFRVDLDNVDCGANRKKISYSANVMPYIIFLHTCKKNIFMI